MVQRLNARGGSVGVETADVLAPGAPLLFMLRDPDRNHVVVVEEAPGR